ncbi:MAG: esterase, partial [Gammaproteobacteria bacterium]
YDLMAADVAQSLARLNLSSCDILGHSMGGKVALKLALNHAELVDRLVIADIAPVSYEHDYDHLIDPILALSLASLDSRKQADQLLKPAISDDLLRAFLLQNLVQEANQWRWRVNWGAIKNQLPELTGFALPSEQWRIDAPTLFINGGESPYIGKLEKEIINAHFSQVEFATIPAAGHWLHAEKPDEFSKLVIDYLS